MSFDYGFLDNDVIFDFAALNLLDELRATLPITDSFFRLRSAPEKAAKLGRLSKKARERAIEFCESLNPCSFVADVSQDLADFLLEKEHDIDGGEAILFACCAEAESSLVISGDSKAIYGLGRLRSDARVHALSGRVVLCEAVMLKLGWAKIREGLRLADSEASTVSRCLALDGEAAFRVRMSTKIHQVQSATGLLLDL